MKENIYENLHPVKRKEFEIRDKILEFVNIGFLYFKPFKDKAVKIKKFQVEGKTINFLLESQFGEEYDYVTTIEDLNDFLSLFTHKEKQIIIVNEVEKEITKKFNQIEIGLTSNYERFKFIKNGKSNLKYKNNITESLNQFGNISPIIVVNKFDKLIILDGKIRFIILSERKEDIFYIDVTKIIKPIINEKLITESNINLNFWREGIKLKEIWPELCKYYYPQYRELNLWMETKEIEKYINKFSFIFLMEKNISTLMKGQANFENKQKIFNFILFLYKDNERCNKKNIYKLTQKYMEENSI